MLVPDFVTQTIDGTESYAKFVFTPLPAGFGNSMGNALRRVMLSSLEGPAITYVKMNDVVHPFSTLEGVKESGLEIILNLKELRFRATGKGPFTLTLSHKGKGVVTGADFKGDVEVVNTDQQIAELTTPKAHLDIELTIEMGIGYSPSEEKEKPTFGTLAMDSVFSPVKRTTFKVEDERVGRKTNFDKLTLEVWTDGSITPHDALTRSAHILGSFFTYMMSGEDVEGRKSAGSDGVALTGTAHVDPHVYEIIIDELDLPTRVINALLREKIETVGDLAERGQEALVSLKGVGRKSISLIEKEIEKLGVILEDK